MEMARNGKLAEEEVGIVLRYLQSGQSINDCSKFGMLTPSLARLCDRICSEKPELRPFALCGSKGCPAALCALCCHRCKKAALKTRAPPMFLRCRKCAKTRCVFCIRSSTRDPRDALICCFHCVDARCYDCIHPDMDFFCIGNEMICKPCVEYWSSKPCTNPDCRNEVGAATKRCGGCRCARYCSKECQLAMCPVHREECAMMMKKRERKFARQLVTKDAAYSM